MPLYEYVCIDVNGIMTGEVIEHICKHTHRPDELVSSDGRRAILRGCQLVADTPNRWGDTNTTWNRGLNAFVRGQHDIDRICRERGLVPESDLPKYHREDTIKKRQAKEARQEQRDAELDRLMDVHLDGEQYSESNPGHHAAICRVYEEWMPAKPTLNGEFDADLS